MSKSDAEIMEVMAWSAATSTRHDPQAAKRHVEAHNGGRSPFA
ncbi:hypothetical protein AB0M86_47995 [Streptomyces sp. NPDC051639]